MFQTLLLTVLPILVPGEEPASLQALAPSNTVVFARISSINDAASLPAHLLPKALWGDEDLSPAALAHTLIPEFLPQGFGLALDFDRPLAFAATEDELQVWILPLRDTHSFDRSAALLLAHGEGKWSARRSGSHGILQTGAAAHSRTTGMRAVDLPDALIAVHVDLNGVLERHREDISPLMAMLPMLIAQGAAEAQAELDQPLPIDEAMDAVAWLSERLFDLDAIQASFDVDEAGLVSCSLSLSAMPGTTLAGDIAGIHQGPPRLGLALDPDLVAGAIEWTATVQRGDPSDEDIEGLRLLFGDDFPVEELTRQGQILQDLMRGDGVVGFSLGAGGLGWVQMLGIKDDVAFAAAWDRAVELCLPVLRTQGIFVNRDSRPEANDPATMRSTRWTVTGFPDSLYAFGDALAARASAAAGTDYESFLEQEDWIEARRFVNPLIGELGHGGWGLQAGTMAAVGGATHGQVRSLLAASRGTLGPWQGRPEILNRPFLAGAWLDLSAVVEGAFSFADQFPEAQESEEFQFAYDALVPLQDSHIAAWAVRATDRSVSLETSFPLGGILREIPPLVEVFEPR